MQNGLEADEACCGQYESGLTPLALWIERAQFPEFGQSLLSSSVNQPFEIAMQ